MDEEERKRLIEEDKNYRPEYVIVYVAGAFVFYLCIMLGLWLMLPR